MYWNWTQKSRVIWWPERKSLKGSSNVNMRPPENLRGHVALFRDGSGDLISGLIWGDISTHQAGLLMAKGSDRRVEPLPQKQSLHGVLNLSPHRLYLWRLSLSHKRAEIETQANGLETPSVRTSLLDPISRKFTLFNSPPLVCCVPQKIAVIEFSLFYAWREQKYVKGCNAGLCVFVCVCVIEGERGWCIDPNERLLYCTIHVLFPWSLKHL